MHVHQLESELDIQRKHSGQTLDEVVSEAQAAKEAHGSQIQSLEQTIATLRNDFATLYAKQQHHHHDLTALLQNQSLQQQQCVCVMT